MRPNLWLAVGLVSVSGLATGQTLTEWVQTNPTNAQDRIALGYPVPIPVDTSLPFDGFRTYAGLHARHQALAAATPWVHPEAVGQTRNGRTIWAYRLGDDDRLTPWGLPEPATLANGGIHAREWQTPETVTGILELMATQPPDHHFYDYLREQVNMVVIPVLNIDGFLQTQAYPSRNWLGSDPNDPQFSPRDGRMRRKNMRQADDQLDTLADHLNGVDLNRNNPPFWDTSPGNSSDDRRSLVHHGPSPHSEPETGALDAAAALGPADQLRIYTDVHSFSQVHFWVRNANERLARQTSEVLRVFSDHHQAFPTGKRYLYSGVVNTPQNVGIGTTDEYFTHEYQVPSWTLEIEPSGGQPAHAPLPGAGADYGGAGVNGHDGFILPESQIRRVREELAQTFAAVYYRQSGPPNVQAVRVVDPETSAVLYEATWDPLDHAARTLFSRQNAPLQLGRPYTLWVAFSKPMRWLGGGDSIVAFPGTAEGFLFTLTEFRVNDGALALAQSDTSWPVTPGGAPDGYARYRTDTMKVDFTLAASAQNEAAVGEQAEAVLRLFARDMTAMNLDTDPATVATWSGGNWQAYENDQGEPADIGGSDRTLALQLSTDEVEAPFLVQPGITASWYDPGHSGEGFVIETLADGRAVLFWFTYDGEGEQDWYLAEGTIRGNRLVFPELRRYAGGEFGPGFDPDLVTSEVVGSARFTWTDCNNAYMDWHIGNQRARQQLVRLSSVLGLDCGDGPMPAVPEQAVLTGAWYDPSHSGEGYVVEMLDDGRVLVYWFSYGPDGERRWFTGIGAYQDGSLVFDDMITTRGGIFGDGFDPAAVERLPWGELELDIDCTGGTANYASTEDGFGSGTLDVVKLIDVDGPGCGG